MVLSLVAGGVVGAVLIEGVINISKTAMAKRGVKAAKEWIADAFKAGRKIPEGIKDFATLMRLRNVIVGNLVKSLDEGHAILRRLTEGDVSALERIGVNTPPKDFDPRINEWGLGELPDGQYVIIKGEDSAVDWGSGPLKNVKPVAHTHTLTEGRLLRGEFAQGATLDDLFGGGIDFATNRAKSLVVPSASDFGIAVNKGLDKHVVHTPYVHLGDGRLAIHSLA